MSFWEILLTAIAITVIAQFVPVWIGAFAKQISYGWVVGKISGSQYCIKKYFTKD